MKKDLYLDVYTILNPIQLIIWTICAFRILNPHQWSFAKEINLKISLNNIYSTNQTLI